MVPTVFPRFRFRCMVRANTGGDDLEGMTWKASKVRNLTARVMERALTAPR
jgi:hypothetical protein